MIIGYVMQIFNETIFRDLNFLIMLTVDFLLMINLNEKWMQNNRILLKPSENFQHWG